MRRRSLLAVLVTTALLNRGALHGQDISQLSQEPSSERHLARGEDHRYHLTLAAGEFVSVTVTQLSLDVVIDTRTPDDREIAMFQDDVASRGVEHVELVADTAGTYTFAVKRAPGTIGAGAYTIRLATRRTATAADRSMQEARALRTAAAGLTEDGKLDDARPLLERALSIAERVLGPDEPFTINVVCDLASNMSEARNNMNALILYQRALTVLSATKGDRNPETAFVQSRIAILYQRAGLRPKAESLIRQALDVIENTLGADHIWFVQGLVTLSNLRNDAGDVDKAQEIEERALAIVEKLGETDTLLYAGLVNNLGDI